MANIYVNSAAAGTNAGTSWTNAYTSIASALPGSAGDNIYVASTHSETFTVTTTLTPTLGVTIYSTSDTTNMPPTTYAAGATINLVASAVVNLNINGGSWFGVSFIAGNGNAFAQGIQFCTANNTLVELESCTVYFNNTSTSSVNQIGPANATSARAQFLTNNCTFKFGSTGQGIGRLNGINCRWRDVGSNFDGGTVHPTTLFNVANAAFHFECDGGDLSGNANTLFPDSASGYVVKLTNCLINAAATIQATQSVDGGGEVYLYDCGTISYTSSDQTIQYAFAHFSYRGSTLMSAAKYVTADGASYDGTHRHSMVITGVNATYALPYRGPWIDAYTAGGASVTPYFEAARDGSATKYNDNEAWAEFTAKLSAGSVRSTLSTDRTALLGTAAAQATGAGTGSWTGLSGTAASMKLDAGGGIAPANVGFVRGRVVMAVTGTLYVDPKIRGL